MLRIYRNNQPLTSIAVLLYFIPLALSDWLQPQAAATQASASSGILLKQSLELLAPYKHLLFASIAILLVFWSNYFINHYRLNKRPSYIGAITGLLMLYAFAESGLPSAALIANIPLLLGLQNIYKAYERKNSIVEVYNAGFWVAIAALCYSPALWMMLFMIIAWFQLRSFNFKELLILLSGLATPFFLLSTYLLIYEQFYSWWQDDFTAAFGNMQLSLEWTPINITPLIWIGIVLLWSLVNFSTLKQKTTIKEQKYLNVLLTGLFTVALSWIGLAKISIAHWGMMLLFFSMFLNLNLQALKNQRMAALIHWLLLATVLLVQWYGYL